MAIDIGGFTITILRTLLREINDVLPKVGDFLG
jgi:hypothetical protein